MEKLIPFQSSLKVKIVFTTYLFISLAVTFFYILSFGYSFWGTDKGGPWLDILAWSILLILMALQFSSKTRTWSWLLLTPSYILALSLLSNIERLNINVIYLGFVLSAVMMTLAAVLNRFLIK